ncbi:unnamed protein product [Linum tenue]|uniref:Uncharacterized protein n=1 Tax=Linum tenue TaxID=586396 RepID=A0AAV0ICU4_9ROSI|nr:unnamed protein product [Linum tenue]
MQNNIISNISNKFLNSHVLPSSEIKHKEAAASIRNSLFLCKPLEWAGWFQSTMDFHCPWNNIFNWISSLEIQEVCRIQGFRLWSGDRKLKDFSFYWNRK